MCSSTSPMGQRGQSTVEAALLLPALLVTLALLVEPACVLYTRQVMEATAAELCRIAATRRGDVGDGAVRAFALRRLGAVPDVAPFHAGGDDDWVVDVVGGEGDQTVAVTISGHVALLPLFGAVAGALGVAGDEGLPLEVRVEERIRPSWLEGSYGDWISMWG